MDGKIKKIISRESFLSLFTFLLIAFGLEISSAARANHEPCPAGTVPIQGHKCLRALTSDMTLSSTIVVGSRTILDCQGHTLTPSVVGTLDDATTPAVNEFTPSQPDLAIFLNNTVEAKVQNCLIEGFDFGVFTLNSYNNAIKKNTIHVRSLGIHVINSGNNKLSENEVNYGSESGRGIFLDGNGDDNIVEGNHVTSTGDDETSFDANGHVNVAGFIQPEPGISFPAVVGGRDIAIMISGTTYDLLNLNINGTVIQVPRVVSANPDDDTPNGNILAGNVTHHVDITSIGSSTRQSGLFFASGTHDALMVGNQASGGKYGIFNAGEGQNSQKIVPGICTLSGKYCINSSDVNCAAGEGICTGQPPPVTVDGRNFDNVMEGNILTGPYYVSLGQPPGGSGIQVQNNNVNVTVRGNTISGDLPSNSIPIGIGLSGKALETVKVERNTVSGATVGLNLIQRQSAGAANSASVFGAEVALNDLTGNGTNVSGTGIAPPAAPQPYNLATELSVAGQGNYWGHSCAESNGFIEFGLPGADSDNALVIDSHPYGEAVALQDPVTATVCPVP